MSDDDPIIINRIRKRQIADINFDPYEDFIVEAPKQQLPLS